jgi:Uncharacterized protein with SCP/PR1 domains
MNWIDLLFVLIIALAMYGGWKIGFIKGTISLLSWAISLAVGFLVYKPVGNFLNDNINGLGEWSFPLAFILLIIISRFILLLAATKLFSGHLHSSVQSKSDRILGLLPGFVNGVIYSTILAGLFYSMPFWSNQSTDISKSRIAGTLSYNIEWINQQLAPIFNRAVQKSFTNYTVEPEANEIVKLHFTINNAKAREDLESKMLELVNQERIKRGLKPLKADPQLTVVGRMHSQDMFSRGYFSHYTPEGKDPFDRMKAAHVHFLSAGENLALGQTLMICHEGLMNSPGHRANILNPSFGRLGIGILDGGVYGLMISQEFRN